METRQTKQGSASALLSDAASPAQLRVDFWNRLRDGVERIADKQPVELRTELESLFRRLEELERLWAYPGAERIDELRQLYSAESDVDTKKELIRSTVITGDHEALLNIIQTERDIALKLEAVRTLGVNGGKNVSPTLVNIYGADKNPEIRRAVAQALQFDDRPLNDRQFRQRLGYRDFEFSQDGPLFGPGIGLVGQ